MPRDKLDKLNTHGQFEKIVKIIEILRGPDGCPWDKEQTRDSLKTYLIEEVHEVIEAIEEKNPKLLMEELGDLLFQVLFHIELAREEKVFTVNDVLEFVYEKMVRRHPHVFEERNVKNSKEVLLQWEDIKRREKKDKKSSLERIPKTLPALLYALRLQDKASRVGFDWKSVEEVYEKLKEEISEFHKAFASGIKEELEEEIGDLFFTLVNISRFLAINPEEALKKSSKKFISRFQFIEREVGKSGKNIESFSLDELEKLWEKAKFKER
ncbi:MAG: nucleoside triphosphate pyrophosphohydrolase [Candidatus Schekmanbacteria bacterium GWA2_38_11]|uniref:Nucleoside triphosphate pyrophosphohydrolase n=1 Tax=Candidatus Schekmanbacteria bacterium GWA2_38_11 TaxID=1817876 RepID=A0A1F7RPM3_9BACT|nr:MAG: nucleoside triphosphate pyrophosphohydrolase [Candidatus Schekmanbacteria bacterium GWA2_38_11]